MNSPRELESDRGFGRVVESRRAVLKLAGALGMGVVASGLAQACGEPPRTLSEDKSKPALPQTTSPVAHSLSPSMPAATNQPSPFLKSERVRIAHLLRRAGFGASQNELDRFEKMGLQATVDFLIEYEGVDNSSLESQLRSLNLDLTKAQDLQRWWLLRMVYTERPLEEKMTLFWHGLLTSGLSRTSSDRMRKQNELLRQHALGRYDVLLKAISRDPAMLVWLDSQSNRKSAPNENFARELMELFSLGVGNYSEQDVRESARAFTGYFLNNQGFVFNANQHDNGTKTFLRVQGNLGGDDVVDIIMRQTAATTFICRKLFSFFAYSNPEEAVLSRLEEVFVKNDFSTKAVMRELLTSEAFYSQKAYRSRPKSPVEFVAGTIRSLGLQTDAVGLPARMTRMGQTLFDPPNVAGWPGGAAWINSSALLERLNFVNFVAAYRKDFNPAETLDRLGLRTPQEVTAFFTGLLLDGNMTPKQRAVLDEYSIAVMKIVDADLAVRAILYLILGSPDCQLA